MFRTQIPFTWRLRRASGLALAVLCLAFAWILALASTAAAQTQRSFKLDNTDLSYTRNAGWTYEIVGITVSDPVGLRINASNVVTTGTGSQRLQYILFPANAVVPAGLRNFGRQRRDTEAVAWQVETNPNTRGPRTFRDGPNPTSLSNGEYQLVVSGYDPNGRRGDYSFDLELTGAVFGLLLSAPPPGGVADFAAATSGASMLVVRTAQGVARDQGARSLSFRDTALNFARAPSETGELTVTASRQDAPGLAGNLYTWVELTGFAARDDTRDRDISGYGLQIGADIAMGPNAVIGLSLGYDEIQSDRPGVSIDGDMLFVQPYLAFRSGPWHGEATVILGRGTFDQEEAGGTGQGETELTATTLELRYDHAVSLAWLLSPSFGFSLGQEEIEGTGGLLAGTAATEVDFAQVSLGLRGTRMTAQSDMFLGAYLDWTEMGSPNSLVAEALMDDGFSARLELGQSLELGNGRLLDSSIELGGLGSDVTSLSGALRVSLRF
ncbi:MAG: autotransporter domain-containing protein [Pseudomonadota bacterium]